MKNFNFVMPTKIIFGKGTETKVGEAILDQKGEKVLVLFGGGSVKKSGLLDKVYDSLDKASLEYVSLGGVVPNPRLSKVREGIDLCLKENVDFILAVGGGSVIDSAKAIGYGITNEEDVWDFFINKAEPKSCAPIGVILTLSGAGSETSDGSVVTNEDGWLKRACGSDYSRPRFAIMNPELTYSLSAYQTACGGTDILMHTMERYFTTVTNVELSDGFCESLMKTVMHNLKIVLKNPEDYDACAEVMWAGSLSHNGLLSCGRIGDWATHELEHELSGKFDVTHGAGLAAVWGSWARYVLKTDVARFAQFAVNVMGCTMDYHDAEKTAYEGIETLESFFRSIGMPVSIKELGLELSQKQVEELAESASNHGQSTIGEFKKLHKEDIVKIYSMAL